jgi:hypothetical protein
MPRRLGRGVATCVAIALASAAAPAARAQQGPSFTAALDRDVVTPGTPFAFEVSLSAGAEDVSGYRDPDFGSLEVVSSFPSQMQFSNGQSVVQKLSWRYELVAPSGKGPFTIGAARVRVGGRELATKPVTVRVSGAGGLFPGVSPKASSGPPAVSASDPDAVASIRAAASKTRVYVGEQVKVGWYLYLTESQRNFESKVQPRADGFWSEEIPSPNPPRQLSFTDRYVDGRHYQVAVLLERALFPLQAGKLTVTPMEADVSSGGGDFFFPRPVRVRHLVSEPLTIEAIPLPTEHKPAGFTPGNVGRYTIEAAVDRAQVAVGDAVTLTVTAKGIGNVRNLRMPELPALDGWKRYEPKASVDVQPGDETAGSSSIEWLLRPERPGTATIPALTLATFDPVEKQYKELRTAPIEVVVTGEAAPAAAGPAAPTPSGGAENVLAAQIRPIRVRARPAGAGAATFVHSAAFKATLAAPPLMFLALVFGGRLRARLGGETDATRRRRLRARAHRRLHDADAHRAAGRIGDAYVEIERVLREVLTERLGTPVGGLRLDEIGALLRGRGLGEAEAARVVAALAACDEARFAPPAGAGASERATAALTEAEEIIALVEKAGAP